MRSDTVLDYAVFDLSPNHSQCQLFVSSNQETEKLASGLIQPFVNHLRLLKTPTHQSSIRLEVETSKHANTWFTKRTLERFVQFVNSPEALVRVNTCYTEMSQLEAARTQRRQDSKVGASDDGAAADATKKELLRAIDLRLEAIKKDLTISISHAAASGFDPLTVSHLQQFADKFGAHHLGEACSKYISLWKKRPDLIDMKHSDNVAGAHEKQNAVKESEHLTQESATTSVDVGSPTVKASQHTRRLSVQDRINLFESKQKESSNSGGSKPVGLTKSVSRRGSIVSEMSIDFSSEKKSESSTESTLSTPSPIPHTSALTESSERTQKYELKSDAEKVGDEEASRDRDNSSKTSTGKSLVSRNKTDSFVDRQRNVTSDTKSRQKEEAINVSQSSVMFPSRHTRSRSAHVEANFQEDHYRSFVSRIKKKEVVLSEEQPVYGPDDGTGKHKARLSKENPGDNDELKMKANELEKLFAEHKLRVPGDQSSSSRRGKPSETQVEHPEPSHSILTAEKRLNPSSGSGDLSKFTTPLVSDTDKGDALRRNFSDLSLTGKLYDKYMKKRDAKLREEWSLKKGEKEAKLKWMQEALEQSRTEMRLSASQRQDSLSSTRHRAEKFRSFNSRSSMKMYQHPINSFQSEEDDDCPDQRSRTKDKQSVGNIASRSSQARKLQPNKNMSSSITPRTAASVPKPSGEK